MPSEPFPGRAATIVERIRADIVAGDLRFGARLTIDSLAGRYDTSHMPVREALRELHGEGIVVIEPKRGARVRMIDEAYVADLLDIRATLEAKLARKAAERITPAALAGLQHLEDQIEARMAVGDYPGILAANRQFHQMIYAQSGNADVAATIDKHWPLLAALWQKHGFGPERFTGVASDHQHLLLALAQRDGAAAEAVMAGHAMKAKLLLIAKIRGMAAEAPATDRPTGARN
ncbi:MAG: GntR family transcriptional regulator [Burkholderiaceae bacterium]